MMQQIYRGPPLDGPMRPPRPPHAGPPHPPAPGANGPHNRLTSPPQMNGLYKIELTVAPNCCLCFGLPLKLY